MAQSSKARQARVGERIADFLCRMYPTKTASCVAADTGLGMDAVQKWLDRASAPSANAIGRLIEVYGPEVVACLVEESLSWIGEAMRRMEAARDRMLAALPAGVEREGSRDG